VSGTGVVAEGVQFTSGKCVLNWLSNVSAVNVYDTIEAVETIHGHEGSTVVVFDERRSL
jgi:hypothetical protein